MAKKITLTVTESLAQKIDEWRSSFNLSRLFQDAVSEAIKRKEEFQRMITGKADIPQIVERLKAEKMGLLDTARNAGELGGTAWASKAHYRELISAVTPGSHIPPYEDDAARIFREWESSSGAGKLPEKEREDMKASFYDGWSSGVSGLWELVRDQLEDK